MKAAISCKCNVANLTHIWRRFVIANAILDNIINATSKICYQNNQKNDAVIAIFFQVNIFFRIFLINALGSYFHCIFKVLFNGAGIHLAWGIVTSLPLSFLGTQKIIIYSQKTLIYEEKFSDFSSEF